MAYDSGIAYNTHRELQSSFDRSNQYGAAPIEPCTTLDSQTFRVIHVQAPHVFIRGLKSSQSNTASSFFVRRCFDSEMSLSLPYWSCCPLNSTQYNTFLSTAIFGHDVTVRYKGWRTFIRNAIQLSPRYVAGLDEPSARLLQTHMS
jgi:hypothetical protein